MMSIRVEAPPAFVLLLEELLDANLDTIEKVLGDGLDFDWLRHVDYLRALHRQGEAVLARLP